MITNSTPNAATGETVTKTKVGLKHVHGEACLSPKLCSKAGIVG